MLKSLDAQHNLANTIAGKKGEKPRDDFFSTHPNTQDRVKRALAAARKTGISAGARDQGRNRFLKTIDGMIYGDDPAQGLVRGSTFWHPSLKLTFTVPQGYKLQNGSESVVARGVTALTKGAMMVFSGGGLGQGGLENYTQQVWQKTVGNKAYLRDVQNIRINGMKAITGWAEMQQKETILTLRIVAIEFSDTQAYHFINVTQKANNHALASAQYDTVGSFRRLSAREATKYKAKRIRIVTVKRGDTLSSLAAKMDFPNYKLERFLALNGFTRQTILQAGSRVKVIIMDR
jgi:predicted Zn-dependent protease